jgi:hypothetical protein
LPLHPDASDALLILFSINASGWIFVVRDRSTLSDHFGCPLTNRAAFQALAVLRHEMLS